MKKKLGLALLSASLIGCLTMAACGSGLEKVTKLSDLLPDVDFFASPTVTTKELSDYDDWDASLYGMGAFCFTKNVEKEGYTSYANMNLYFIDSGAEVKFVSAYKAKEAGPDDDEGTIYSIETRNEYTYKTDLDSYEGSFIIVEKKVVAPKDGKYNETKSWHYYDMTGNEFYSEVVEDGFGTYPSIQKEYVIVGEKLFKADATGKLVEVEAYNELIGYPMWNDSNDCYSINGEDVKECKAGFYAIDGRLGTSIVLYGEDFAVSKTIQLNQDFDTIQANDFILADGNLAVQSLKYVSASDDYDAIMADDGKTFYAKMHTYLVDVEKASSKEVKFNYYIESISNKYTSAGLGATFDGKFENVVRCYASNDKKVNFSDVIFADMQSDLKMGKQLNTFVEGQTSYFDDILIVHTNANYLVYSNDETFSAISPDGKVIKKLTMEEISRNREFGNYFYNARDNAIYDSNFNEVKKLTEEDRFIGNIGNNAIVGIYSKTDNKYTYYHYSGKDFKETKLDGDFVESEGCCFSMTKTEGEGATLKTTYTVYTFDAQKVTSKAVENLVMNALPYAVQLSYTNEDGDTVYEVLDVNGASLFKSDFSIDESSIMTGDTDKVVIKHQVKDGDKTITKYLLVEIKSAEGGIV